MLGLLTFLNPLVVFLLLNIVILATYEIHSNVLLSMALSLIPLSVLVTIYFSRVLREFSKREDSFTINLVGQVWRIVGYSIVCVSIIEIIYFGIPIIGQIVYINFGFPFLHHIAVSTWLLIFIRVRPGSIQLLFTLFAIAFPILIINRDLFLFTVFCLICRGVSRNRLNIGILSAAVILALVMFGVLGEIRSGDVQTRLLLPTKFELESINVYVFWVFIYITSPMFNAHYSFLLNERALYEPLLTVIPEFYRFVEILSFFGFYIYIFAGLLLILIPRLFRLRDWLCLSVFIYFQFFMGMVFSNKLFNSHTLYVLLLFLVIEFFRRVTYWYRIGLRYHPKGGMAKTLRPR
jgi:hypothetical protein